MRNPRTLPAVLLLPVLAFAAGCGASGPRWVDYGDDFMTSESFNADSAAAATPGAAHAELMKGVGEWNVESRFYMAPDAEPTVMQAKAVVVPLLGGRYLQETFTGDLEGMPFEGILITGYDNLAGQYWSLWLDSWSTWAIPSSGDTDEQGNLHMTSVFRDVRTPEGRPARMEFLYQDDGSYLHRMYDSTPEGGEILIAEFHYRRA